ncbi:GNAT family N-acetyltransferase [Marinicella sediminis]|uniref:GNAT family N-acetyltransferase n=1 Tax=Marinicella sediminis TaxID=1792834 RepID=A0ABV7JCS0_9GAMM|nr:GNAT family N-acetyltransferase [Marinicella sediminis]
MQRRLIVCNDEDLRQVFKWFTDAGEVLKWGGPDLTFPLELDRFKKESKHHKSQSFVLSSGSELLAFGQFYNRLERIHLGRLVVAPVFRGQRLGEHLIEALIDKGKVTLGLSDAALFVLSDNLPAMRLYRRLGFTEQPYPKPIPLANCIYMIRPQKPQ